MKKIVITAGIVGILGAGLYASAAVIKPWKDYFQVANITTRDQKTIEVYKFDDDNGVSCYVISKFGYVASDAISCVKVK